jgi:hypothetical protein
MMLIEIGKDHPFGDGILVAASTGKRLPDII